MALSTTDLQPATDHRLIDQQATDLDRGFVTITVDGNEYRVRRGAHSMASLTKTAVLLNPPNFLAAKALESRKGEKYQAADTIDIEGGEVFVSTATGAPGPRGFNRAERPLSHGLDERTPEQRANDQRNYVNANPVL